MKTILISGLDGSGKSTLLKRLQQLDGSFDIIFVPHIDIRGLNGELLRVAQFVNYLNQEADQRQIPQFKAIALFASMVIFRSLVEVKKKPGLKYLFFERHPLFDTGIYARFYARKLGPGSIDQAVLQELDHTYTSELSHLFALLPQDILRLCASRDFAAFLELIYRWFHIEQKYSIAHLSALFQLPLPDELYFLRADPTVLYDRIRDREHKEAHESVEVLQKLDEVYNHLCISLEREHGRPVNIIDANAFDELENLYLFFSKMIHES